ncbi:MAG: peptidylprolyl isomerase [Bacteroidia bacterium]
MKIKIYSFALLISIMTTTTFAQSDKKGAPAAKDHIVQVTTDYGSMKIKLYNETPKHRDNFLKLAKEGFYNGTLFHRVMSAFMLQGGDPDSKNAAPDKMLGAGDIGYTVPAEFNPALYHKKGALCAARRETPTKESSGCQFYIVQGKKYTDAELDQMEARAGIKYTADQRKVYTTVGGTPFLDMSYTVYGEVIEGMDVIDKICAVPTKPGDRPVKDVKMTVKVIQ